MSTSEFTLQERTSELEWHIDNGFIYHKKCFSVFGDQFLSFYSRFKKQDESYPNNVFNDNLLVKLAIDFCRLNKIDTLSQALQDPQKGKLFCSIEHFAGTEDVYSKERVKNRILLPYPYEREIYNEFSTKYITCDTGRTEQSSEEKIAIIGIIYKITVAEVVIHPLIMGGPTFDTPFKKQNVAIDKLLFEGSNWFEVKPEEIDNFSKLHVAEATSEEWQNYMRNATEDDIKTKFCEILQETPQKDWGGEFNDHFSNSITIGGKKFTTAFLLKGPAGGKKFKEMLPTFLGKNGDQINRLSKTPADLLILQHCHEIGEAVREMLQVFAVAPHIQKRFCLIDGRDTFKILKAYDKL